jgi:hypothetical protein
VLRRHAGNASSAAFFEEGGTKPLLLTLELRLNGTFVPTVCSQLLVPRSSKNPDVLNLGGSKGRAVVLSTRKEIDGYLKSQPALHLDTPCFFSAKSTRFLEVTLSMVFKENLQIGGLSFTIQPRR